MLACLKSIALHLTLDAPGTHFCFFPFSPHLGSFSVLMTQCHRPGKLSGKEAYFGSGFWSKVRVMTILLGVQGGMGIAG
jgi:hypothetical protein